MSKKQKERFYYYYDEVNDDFANNGIETKTIPDDFDYNPKNPVYKFLKILSWLFFCPIFSLIYKCGQGYPVENYKVVRRRENRKKGYFIYGNHTTWIGDAVAEPMLAFPKHVYTIAGPDALSIKGAGQLIRTFGATPTPASMNNFKNFLKAVDEFYENGNPVVIFPEAHIWPKYHKIRNFPVTSFYFPVKLNAPSYARTTVYKKKKDGHTTAKVYYDGPFYPDPELPFKKAQQDLRDRIYSQMVERTKEAELDCSYHYIKVDSADQVRTEIKEI